MSRFTSLITNGCLMWLLAFTTTMMGPSSHCQAFVTVSVELVPYITSTPPACTSGFVKDFESNLTSWVVNATRSMAFLSDFKAPGGFHLTYNSIVRRRERQLRRSRREEEDRKLHTVTCSRCTSGGCLLSCAIGTCNLCQGSRRQLEAIEADNVMDLQPDDSSTLLLDDHDEQRLRRVQTADWTAVSTAVTTKVKPLVLIYGAMKANGCLGDANRLSVNVTFHSNVVLDATMNKAIVAAFGAPVAAPANAPTACCSMDFVSCVNYCGTTQTQCQTCGAVDAGWMPKGPPTFQCVSRWNNCLNSACCPGLQCLGDQYWKGCFYVPP